MKNKITNLYNTIYYILRDISTYSLMIGANKENKQLLDFFKEYKIPKDAAILDVGCGFGRNLKLLNNQGYLVTGVDVNVEIVETNIENGFTCYTVDNFKSNSNKYDVVIMSHIVEHLTSSELLEFIDFYLDFLKDDGILFVMTPLMTKQFYMDFDHVKPYSHVGISMVFSGKSQVQYYSRNKLNYLKIKYIKVPYNHRTISYKTQSSNTIIKGVIDIIFIVLYYLSFSLIGINANWMCSYTKINKS